MAAVDFTPLKPDRRRLAQCRSPPATFPSSPSLPLLLFLLSFFPFLLPPPRSGGLSFLLPLFLFFFFLFLSFLFFSYHRQCGTKEAGRTPLDASPAPMGAVARGSGSANRRARCWARTNTQEPTWLPCKGGPTGGPLLNSSATPSAGVAVRHGRALPSYGLAEGYPRRSHPLSPSLFLSYSLSIRQ